MKTWKVSLRQSFVCFHKSITVRAETAAEAASLAKKEAKASGEMDKPTVYHIQEAA